MGTHSDGKPVTAAGFPGSYWAHKERREAEFDEAFWFPEDDEEDA